VLSALGSSPTLDESALTYTWVASSKSTGAPDPFFDDNADNGAKSTTATFFQAGSYTFACHVSDGTLVNTEFVSVTVNPTLTSIVTTPDAFSVAASNTYHVSATALDQFGNPLATQPSFSWSASGGGSYSSGIYTAPSGSGPYTLSASATSGGQSATHTASVTIAGGSSPGSAPSSVTDLICSVGDGADVQLVWRDGSGGGALGGFRVEASADGGSTYAPLGFAAAGDTTFIATGLCANSPYSFRVTPYNGAGLGTSNTVSVDSTSSAIGDTWYKVSFQGTPTTQSFTLGSSAHSGDSGSLTLSNSGWIQAGSAADAVRQAITGSFSSGYDSSTFTFGSSGAFRYVSDFSDADGNDLGPAIVVEDEFNASCHGSAAYASAYLLVSAVPYRTIPMASDDQTLYSVPSGRVSVGTFATTDKSASAGDFSATLLFEDSVTQSATITTLGNGNFGVYVSSIASGEPTDSYALQVTHIASSTVSQIAMGSAAFNIAPQNKKPKPVKLNPSLPQVMVGAYLQPQMPTVQGGGQESLFDWSARGVNTIIWPSGFTALSPSSTDYLNFADSTDQDRADLLNLAKWIGQVKYLDTYYALAGCYLKYVIPVQFVDALTAALNDPATSGSRHDARRDISAALNPYKSTTPITSEWADPGIYAVSIRSDEPNSGDLGPPDVRRQAPDTTANSFGTHGVLTDVNEIHMNGQGGSKLAYANLVGNPFAVSLGNFNANKGYANAVDFLSEDYYPVNNNGGASSFNSGDNSALNRLALLLQNLSSKGPAGAGYLKAGASLQLFIEASDQTGLVDTAHGGTPAPPTPAQMGDEYGRALSALSSVGVNLQGIAWFSQGDSTDLVMGTPTLVYHDDNTTAAEAAAIKAIDTNFRALPIGTRVFPYPHS
jgi:hypothetical protein